MSFNNTVTLIGNMGSEAKIIAQHGKNFAAVSLATTDQYKDQTGDWVSKETLWHNILVFNPRLIEELKALKKGTRIKVTGELSYRSFEVSDDEGNQFQKQEASVVAKKVELATLLAKKKTPDEVMEEMSA